MKIEKFEASVTVGAEDFIQPKNPFCFLSQFDLWFDWQKAQEIQGNGFYGVPGIVGAFQAMWEKRRVHDELVRCRIQASCIPTMFRFGSTQ